MADNPNISQIKLPNGSTYDIKDNTSGYTSNTGTITSVKTTAGAHTTINVSSGAAEFNVPTKTSHLTNDSGFLTSSDIASVLTYKGTKASVADLPSTGNTTGDVWHITADGSEYAWDGSIWQELGTAIDLSGYAQLAGASFTGPVTFGDSVTADELNTGDLVVTGSASFVNNIQANTINGVEVGSTPKFTDTVTTVSVTGSGNAVTAASASNGAVTLTKGATFLTSYTETDPTVPSWAKQASKPTYTAAEVGALPASTTIPTKTSELTNDSGFITSYTDEKLGLSLVSSPVDYYPILTQDTTTAQKKNYDNDGFMYYNYNGTTSAVGNAELTLGNNKTATTNKNKQGTLKLYGSTACYLTMATLPIYDGTVV